MSSTTQLTFTLRTSPNCRTVHLLGSWDAYRGQLPLSKDSSTSKPGSWKGTFRFQAATLQPGQRYWYYYIMDGHHASHDPAEAAVVEPTTGRKLNVLDVPGSSSSSKSSSSSRTKRDSRRYSKDVPHGRGLSPSKIQSPRPQKPHATRGITSAKRSDIDELSRRFASARVSASSFSSSDSGSSSDEESDSEIDSDASSSLPSLSSGSRSPTSSMSSGGSSRGSPVSRCTCDRWGTTKRGERVKMDCGGSRCGSDSEGEYYRRGTEKGGKSSGMRSSGSSGYRTARR